MIKQGKCWCFHTGSNSLCHVHWGSTMSSTCVTWHFHHASLLSFAILTNPDHSHLRPPTSDPDLNICGLRWSFCLVPHPHHVHQSFLLVQSHHLCWYQNSGCRSYKVTLKAACWGCRRSGVTGLVGAYYVGARTRPQLIGCALAQEPSVLNFGLMAAKNGGRQICGDNEVIGLWFSQLQTEV